MPSGVTFALSGHPHASLGSNPFHPEVPTQKATLRHSSAGMSVWIRCLIQLGRDRPLGHTFRPVPPQTRRCQEDHGRSVASSQPHCVADPCSSAAGPPSALPLPAPLRCPTPAPSFYPKPGHSHTGRGSWGLKVPTPEAEAWELLQEPPKTPSSQRGTSRVNSSSGHLGTRPAWAPWSWGARAVGRSPASQRGKGNSQGWRMKARERGRAGLCGTHTVSQGPGDGRH